MNKNKIKNLVLIIAIILSIVLGITLFLPKSDTLYLPYKDFVTYIEQGQIESAEIQENKVIFKIKNDDTNYYTDNPEYDSFKEYLLLNDVKLTDSFGSKELFNIFDIMFYAVFIIVIFGVGYKFLGIGMNEFKVIRKTNTKFTDIAGMEELKKDMMKLVDILKNQKGYKEKGIRLPKGIIFEGPPGNGKTLFARALAGEADVNFIATKGADFQSAMMSIGPRKIKALFKKARRNKPCIIFIDEFDGIGERRNYAGTGIDKENNRLIISMLNEMDGFSNEDGVLVIAATNSYASLDAALIRPGRFDRKYRIDNPDKNAIISLIDMYTKSKKLDPKINMSQLVKCFEKLSAAAIETIINEALLASDESNREFITIEDIAKAGKKTGIINIKIV